MPQIFISYKREKKTDEIYLNALIAEIEKLSYDVWYDKEKIRGGESWRQSIEDALENSSVCLVIVTENIFESDWMFFEVSFALGFGITVIPWYVDGEPKKHNSAFGTLLDEIEGIKDLKELKGKLERIKHNYIADFLNEEIAKMTLRPRILLHIASAYLEHDYIDNVIKWLNKGIEALRVFQQDWRNFLLQYAPLINRKQKQVINELIHRFSQLENYRWFIMQHLVKKSKDVQQAKTNNKKLQLYLKDLDLYIEKSLIYNSAYHSSFLSLLEKLNDKTFPNDGNGNWFLQDILDKSELNSLPFLHDDYDDFAPP